VNARNTLTFQVEIYKNKGCSIIVNVSQHQVLGCTFWLTGPNVFIRLCSVATV